MRGFCCCCLFLDYSLTPHKLHFLAYILFSSPYFKKVWAQMLKKLHVSSGVHKPSDWETPLGSCFIFSPDLQPTAGKTLAVRIQMQVPFMSHILYMLSVHVVVFILEHYVPMWSSIVNKQENTAFLPHSSYSNQIFCSSNRNNYNTRIFVLYKHQAKVTLWRSINTFPLRIPNLPKTCLFWVQWVDLTFIVCTVWGRGRRKQMLLRSYRTLPVA